MFFFPSIFSSRNGIKDFSFFICETFYCYSSSTSYHLLLELLFTVPSRIYKMFFFWKKDDKLTDLSPSCSTLHCKNVVWPTLAVTFRGTSKLKYGCNDILCSGWMCSLADTLVRSIEIKQNKFFNYSIETMRNVNKKNLLKNHISMTRNAWPGAVEIGKFVQNAKL